mmetsp:Transcript_10663/g.35386  ORF Transcript_10663/g.35386 Transcript_10663/m.35386 type:complete len:218 (+) Transcript_10663:1910-2563(+)
MSKRAESQACPPPKVFPKAFPKVSLPKSPPKTPWKAPSAPPTVTAPPTPTPQSSPRTIALPQSSLRTGKAWASACTAPSASNCWKSSWPERHPCTKKCSSMRTRRVGLLTSASSLAAATSSFEASFEASSRKATICAKRPKCDAFPETRPPRQAVSQRQFTFTAVVLASALNNAADLKSPHSTKRKARWSRATMPDHTGSTLSGIEICKALADSSKA